MDQSEPVLNLTTFMYILILSFTQIQQVKWKMSTDGDTISHLYFKYYMHKTWKLKLYTYFKFKDARDLCMNSVFLKHKIIFLFLYMSKETCG